MDKFSTVTIATHKITPIVEKHGFLLRSINVYILALNYCRFEEKLFKKFDIENRLLAYFIFYYLNKADKPIMKRDDTYFWPTDLHIKLGTQYNKNIND